MAVRKHPLSLNYGGKKAYFMSTPGRLESRSWSALRNAADPRGGITWG
jgi:hypothetical protein